jgi:hypothetical protein
MTGSLLRALVAAKAASALLAHSMLLPGLAAASPTITYPNWAGYATTAGAYRSVSAQWVIPRGHCPHHEAQAAFWVGLDQSTVEQTGVALDCTGGLATYSGWYQMYPRPAHALAGPVRPGDRMSGSVSYRGHGRYLLRLADLTRHWAHTVLVRHFTAYRMTAEAITEASSGPLARFSPVLFEAVRVDGRPLASFRLDRIDMARGGQVLARATGLWQGRFRVCWHRPGP